MFLLFALRGEKVRLLMNIGVFWSIWFFFFRFTELSWNFLNYLGTFWLVWNFLTSANFLNFLFQFTESSTVHEWRKSVCCGEHETKYTIENRIKSRKNWEISVCEPNSRYLTCYPQKQTRPFSLPKVTRPCGFGPHVSIQWANNEHLERRNEHICNQLSRFSLRKQQV